MGQDGRVFVMPTHIDAILREHLDSFVQPGGIPVLTNFIIGERAMQQPPKVGILQRHIIPVLRSAQITQFWNAPLTKLSQSLVLEEGRYHFTGEDLLAQQDLWLMLVGRDGQVLWQYNKPAEVPDQYDLLDVAAFTRGYLEDYPVQTRIRPDGLLVAGAPKGSTWATKPAR